jgi:uncharacterized membrane protein SpoIIM required for sporulation
MRARQLGCSRDVIGYLDALTARAHNALYTSRSHTLLGAWQVLVVAFPRAFRASARFMLVSALLFWTPFAVGAFASATSPSFASRVLPDSALESLSESYAEGFSKGRDEDKKAAMSGFYVHNNVGIAFQCFATGILFGAGSAFFLLYNGLVIGTVFGYVFHAGHGGNLMTFVSGHSPFELTAIVISGGAGLRMGAALIVTRGLTRLGALRGQAGDLVALVSGAAAMLLIAACIEGFWSPSAVPRVVKYAVGMIGTIAVFSFLLFAGRQPAKASGAR